MSSIANPRSTRTSYNVDTGAQIEAAGIPETNGAASGVVTATAPSGVSTYRSQGVQGTARTLTTAPPTLISNKPANYTANFASAKENVGTGATVTTPYSAAILATENSQHAANNKVATDAVSASDDTTSDSASAKQQTTQGQADSILASTSASTEHGCHVQHTNQTVMVNKMQSLSFKAKEAGVMVRILQDGRSPDSAKQRIAYELAASGMTGAGQANTAALSSNATQMKGELASYADTEANTSDGIHTGGMVATALTGAVGALVTSVATLVRMKTSSVALTKDVQDSAAFADGATTEATATDATGLIATGTTPSSVANPTATESLSTLATPATGITVPSVAATDTTGTTDTTDATDTSTTSPVTTTSVGTGATTQPVSAALTDYQTDTALLRPTMLAAQSAL